MVKYNVGRLKYIPSLTEIFSAGDWVGAVLMLKQKSWKWSTMALTVTPSIYLPATMLWLAQRTSRVYLCLQEAVQVSPSVSLGQGEPDVHHSTLKAKLQRCPSSLYLLIWGWPDFSTAVLLHTACWVRRFAAHLGITKLCRVASPQLLALFSAILLLSVQARMEKELVTLSPVPPYCQNCAGICSPSLH